MSLKTVTSSILGGHATAPSQRRNPFPGARPFSSEEGSWFYGRPAEVAELGALVRAQQFCLLYAPSGAGKSSLINAGVLRALRRGESDDDPDTSGGPFDVIGVAKVHPSAVRGAHGWPDSSIVPNVYVTAALNTLDPDARSPHFTIADYLTARPHVVDEFGDPVPRLLVLDQFEEILEPFGREDWIECRNDFFRQLDDAMRRDPSLHVLVAIREDHLATLERLTSNMTTACRARYRLDKLTTAKARLAIEQPAMKSHLPFETRVVDKLLADLARLRIDQFEDAIPDEFIEPGQLQVVCNRLWAKADADPENAAATSGGDVHASIKTQHVDETGGVEGSLRKYYDDAVSSVSRGVGERRLRKFFEDRLITAHGTRQLVPLDPSAEKTERISNKVLERLGSEYGLVRKERRGGTSYWELSHDGFIQPIRQANAERRVERGQKIKVAMWGAAGLVYMVSVLDITGEEKPSNGVVAAEQFAVDSNGRPGDVRVGIGRRDEKASMVVELIKPPQISASFALKDEKGDTVQPVSRHRDVAQFEPPRTARYSVVVSVGPGAPLLGVNVRPGAALIDLPEVTGTNSTAARERLTEAKLIVSAIRPVCSSVGGLTKDDVVRVIDLDRQAVPGIDGVISEVGSKRSPIRVATGTTVVLEVFDGRPCADG